MRKQKLLCGCLTKFSVKFKWIWYALRLVVLMNLIIIPCHLIHFQGWEPNVWSIFKGENTTYLFLVRLEKQTNFWKREREITLTLASFRHFQTDYFHLGMIMVIIRLYSLIWIGVMLTFIVDNRSTRKKNLICSFSRKFFELFIWNFVCCCEPLVWQYTAATCCFAEAHVKFLFTTYWEKGI